MEKWKTKNTDDFIFFRPKTEDNPEEEIIVEDNEEDDIRYQDIRIEGKKTDSSMLFVYMSATQKQILKRYLFIYCFASLKNSILKK